MTFVFPDASRLPPSPDDRGAMLAILRPYYEKRDALRVTDEQRRDSKVWGDALLAYKKAVDEACRVSKRLDREYQYWRGIWAVGETMEVTATHG